MYKVKIFTLGKVKEAWLQSALEEYLKRLKKTMHVEWVLAKTTAELLASLENISSLIVLDPLGKSLSSPAFAQFIERKGSRLNFVIGGPDGLPLSLKQRADTLLSLSSMTFTHQLTRLILIEQLYRALEISKGSAYHK